MTLQAEPVLAESYEVSLTRKGSNVYKIDGKHIIIQTCYCYMYAYSEDAIFKATGYGGELIFFKSKDKCNVKTVFGLSKQKPGKYLVTVGLRPIEGIAKEIQVQSRKEMLTAV